MEITPSTLQPNLIPITAEDIQEGMAIDGTPVANTPATPPADLNIQVSANGSVMSIGNLQSTNFNVGVAGWRLDSNGNIEANDGNFRGDITGATGTFSTGIKVGGWSINATSIFTGTEDHSGYTANAGDLTIYSNGTVASIHAKNFYIDALGNITATSVTITGSITVDTLEWNKKTIIPTFESLDAWGTSAVGTGAQILIYPGECRLDTGTGSGDITKIWIEGASTNTGYSKNPFFQASIKITEITSQDVAIVVGSNNLWGTTTKFGFRWSSADNKLYAYHYASTTETKTEITGISLEGVLNKYRAELSNGGDTIKFYVNGVLETTHTSAGCTVDSEILFCYGSRNPSDAGNDASYINNLIFSQDL